MQKHRFYLKGSAAEVAWLNHQADAGYQLTAIHGCTYQFEATPTAKHVVAEYLPKTTLDLMTPVFKPFATYVFHDDLAVVYSPVTPEQRVVNDDAQYRLAAYRHARDVALNWLNGWVLAIWLLMSAAIVLSSQLQATPLLTRILLTSLGLGAGLIVLGIVIGARAALSCHREVCRLIQVTGDDQDTWKPTFHVLFKHQAALPDTEQWADLGQWQLTMQNQQGDYYFDLRTTLSELEIRRTIAKLVADKDFTVMSWLGLYSI